jgi:hypothetical protein
MNSRRVTSVESESVHLADDSNRCTSGHSFSHLHKMLRRDASGIKRQNPRCSFLGLSRSCCASFHSGSCSICSSFKLSVLKCHHSPCPRLDCVSPLRLVFAHQGNHSFLTSAAQTPSFNPYPQHLGIPYSASLLPFFSVVQFLAPHIQPASFFPINQHPSTSEAGFLTRRDDEC